MQDTDPHNPPFAIIGLGAIGCALASSLERGGLRAVLCARQRAPDPVIVEWPGTDASPLRSPILDAPAQISGHTDVVAITVKAHQTTSVAPWLRALCGNHSIVAVLQNGIEHAERLAGLVPPDRIVPIVVHCSAAKSSPSHIACTTELRLILPDTPPARLFRDATKSARARIEVSSDFTTDAWRKLCLNAVAGIMAATGRTAEVFQQPANRLWALAVARECIAVARAEGAQIPTFYAEELLTYFSALPPDSSTSILADRLAGRPLEWDARNGVIPRRAAKHGIPTPESTRLACTLASLSPDSQKYSGPTSSPEIGPARPNAQERT